MELESLRYRVRRLEVCEIMTNVLIIFVGDSLPREFERIYDVCPIKKLSGGRRVIGNN